MGVSTTWGSGFASILVAEAVVLLLFGGGLWAWITQNRKILILSPQHHRAATVAKKVLTAVIGLIVEGNIVILLLSGQ